MVDKSCLVSESFGSSSVASLRKPPTWFHRVRACAGENDFTSSDRPPIRPQRPPEHPPLLGHTRLPPTADDIVIDPVQPPEPPPEDPACRQAYCHRVSTPTTLPPPMPRRKYRVGFVGFVGSFRLDPGQIRLCLKSQRDLGEMIFSSTAPLPYGPTPEPLPVDRAGPTRLARSKD